MSVVAKRAVSKPVVVSATRKAALVVQAEKAWEDAIDKARPHGNKKPVLSYVEAVRNAMVAYTEVMESTRTMPAKVTDDAEPETPKKVKTGRVIAKKVTTGRVKATKVKRGTITATKVLEGAQ